MLEINDLFYSNLNMFIWLFIYYIVITMDESDLILFIVQMKQFLIQFVIRSILTYILFIVD